MPAAMEAETVQTIFNNFYEKHFVFCKKIQITKNPQYLLQTKNEINAAIKKNEIDENDASFEVLKKFLDTETEDNTEIITRILAGNTNENYQQIENDYKDQDIEMFIKCVKMYE